MSSVRMSSDSRRHPEIILPGGTKVCCLKRAEAQFIMGEMPGYFRHGIEIKAGDTVLDVGANIGVFSLWVYDQYGADVNVYAFEPIQPIFDVLDLNRVRVGWPNFKTFPFGISNECTTAEFTFFSAMPAISSASVNRSAAWVAMKREDLKRAIVASRSERGFPFLRWLPAAVRPRVLGLFVDIVLGSLSRTVFKTTKVICELRTMSQVVREQAIPRIDLLKIDVEGAELDVLSGIQDCDWPIIRQVVAEVESYSCNSWVVARLLRQHGFTAIGFEPSPSLNGADVGLVFAHR